MPSEDIFGLVMTLAMMALRKIDKDQKHGIEGMKDWTESNIVYGTS